MPTGIGIGSAGQVFGTPLSLTAQCDAQYCYEFDGGTELAYSPLMYNFGTNNFSISIWFKTSDVTGGGAQQDLFGSYSFSGAQTFQIGLNATGKVVFTSNLTGWTDVFTAFTPVNNTWTHIVYSVDRSGNAVWYGDAATTQSLDVSANTTDLFVGGNYTGIAGGFSTNKFDGLIADIAQWDIALTSAQVQEYYDNSKGTPKLCATTALSTSPDLQGWWRFSNPSGVYSSVMPNEAPGRVGSGAGYDMFLINMTNANVITDYPT